MTATEFLNQLKKEQLTGREFLALIGHTDISNEDYSEIKENPLMTHTRLVEILENSPISEEDYTNLLKTARLRKEKQNQVKRREDLETQLTRVLSGEIPVEDVTEEINLDSLEDDVSVYHVTTAEELWADLDSDNTDGSDALSEEDNDEYGGDKDFDKSARRENLPKIIICLSMGVILVFSSFLIRYMTTGSWGVSGFAHKTPQSYKEIFELQLGKPARETVFDSQKVWRAERFTEPIETLSTVAASNRYLFKIIEHSLHAAEIDSGMMHDAPSFEPEQKILGMFEQNNNLYVVCAGIYTYTSNSEENSIEDFETNFSLSQTVVYEFDALDFTGIPANEYKLDGIFKQAILHDGGFFIITDYIPNNDPNYHVPVEISNIEFIKDATYSNMILIASVSHNNLEVYGVSGNSADCVYFSGKSLIMSFYSDKKNESRILRYNVFGSVLSSPVWGSVPGKVSYGFINESESAGMVRIVTDLGDVSALHILGKDLSLTARSGTVTTNGGVIGAAFDEKTAYIIANQPPEVFSIDTSGSKPVFLNQTDALISDKEFYAWGDNRFFSVDVDYDEEGNRQGIMAAMYYQPHGSDAPPKLEQNYRLALSDAVWHDYTHTSAEIFREAVAASRESGVIVIPVTYFNAVTRVESFIALNYLEKTETSEDSNSGEFGFTEVGKITEIGFNTRYHAASIRGGYIYTFWDDVVRSAATDLTMIDTHEL
ncbi:MAG: hypothetical protein FWG33_05005 [Oscillospiraceae bacterium]|nr:hypothetical protein [Oscillospiraceae bacterium]